jgi:Uncharacterized protein conserved in bacteria (DUF2188)
MKDNDARSMKVRSDIHVGLGDEAAWLVTRGDEREVIGTYRVKSHAMAFARAVAYSCHTEMVVHERGGQVTHHARASLSYPTSLD